MSGVRVGWGTIYIYIYTYWEGNLFRCERDTLSYLFACHNAGSIAQTLRVHFAHLTCVKQVDIESLEFSSAFRQTTYTGVR